MSGQGKYTKYASPASDKNTLLNKLFHSNDALEKPPTQDLVGKETDARQAVVDLAKQLLDPAHQDGDTGYFPQGVDLDFSGASATIQPPNTAEGKDVVWKNAGDPASAYFPDLSSPGPGKTEGLDKDVDPKLAVKDIKPNYVAAAPNTGTKSPTATNAKIVAAALLGVSGKLGDSGANS